MKITQILTRIYVNEIEPAISFHEELTDEKCANRFEYKQANLEIARVGNFLIIAGSNDALRSFRDTSATLSVDSLSACKELLVQNGSTVIQDIRQVPTGFKMIIKHKGGSVFEYVELKKIKLITLVQILFQGRVLWVIFTA